MADEPIINQYLRYMLEKGGSDLHLSINNPVKSRIHGNIVPITDDIITPEFMEAMLQEIGNGRISVTIRQ